MKINELNKKIKVLEKKLNPLYELRSKTKEDKTKKDREKNVGKCFKCWNFYNSDDKWRLFRKIIDVNSFGYDVLSFEKENDGDFRIDTNSMYSIHDDETEISQKEFSKKLNELLEEINDKNGN